MCFLKSETTATPSESRTLISSALYKADCEVFKYLNEFTTTRARGLFDYDLNDRTRNNEAKLIVKHFNASVAKHFYPIKITSTWNALPSEVVSSRTVNSFKNSLDKHWAENPPNVRVNW